MINRNADGYTWCTYALNPRTGNKCAVIYTDFDEGNDDYLITPPLALTGNQELKFWTRSGSLGEPEEISVLLSTTTPTAEAFTEVLMASTPVNYVTYMEHTLNLSAYSGICYISFTRKELPANGWLLYIDDVTIRDLPTAPIFSYTPDSIDFGTTQAYNPGEYTNVEISNTGINVLNLTAADISLMSGSGQFEYDTTSGFPAALAAGQSVSLPVRFAPDTIGTHTETLRINYGGDNYDVALTGNALSRNALVEGFEGATFPPDRWSIHNGGDANTWGIYASPRTGVNAAGIAYSYTAHDDWLITPPLVVTADEVSLSFWARNGSNNWPEQFNVMLSTTTNEIASFTQTLASAVTPPNTYTQYSYNLTPYIGQNVYIAVQAISTDQLNLYVDDFIGPSVYAPPDPVTLVSPVNGATDLPKNGFDLTWAAASTGGAPDYYKLYIASSVETIYGEVVFDDITGTSYNPVTDGGFSFNYEDRWFWTVQAVNTSGTAEVYPPQYFDIQQAPYITAIPYNIDFEAHADNTLPEGWNRSTLGDVGWKVGTAVSSVFWTIPDHTVYAAANDDEGGVGNDGSMDLLIMPLIDLSAAPPPSLELGFDSFFDASYSQTATVEITTDEGANWSTLYTVPDATEWIRCTVPLNDYLAAPFILRFHSDDNTEWGSGWAIDNVSIAEPLAYDVAALSLHIPEVVNPAPFIPQATVINNGVNAETFDVELTFGAQYTDVQTVTALDPGTSYLVSFASFTPTVDTGYIATVTTQLMEDMNEDNDTLEDRLICINLDIPAYADVAYDPDAILAGPATFNLQSPDSITDLLEAPDALRVNFMPGADWIAGDNGWHANNFVDPAGVTPFWHIDATSGLMSQSGSTPAESYNAVAYDAINSVWYGSKNVELYTFDPVTGTETLVGFYGDVAEWDGLMIGIAHDNYTGTLYGVDLIYDALFIIDKTTGEATGIGYLGIDINYAQDIAIDQDTGYLYAAAYTTTGTLYWIDTSDGSAWKIGDFQSGSELTGFAIPHGLASPEVSIAADGTLSWSAVENADFYTIHGSMDPNPAMFGILDTTPNLSWLDPSFPAAKMFYRVSANTNEIIPRANRPAFRSNFRSAAPAEIYIKPNKNPVSKKSVR